MKKRILIKISGGCLQSSDQKELFDPKKLENLCQQIKIIAQNYTVGIVVGGGNLWRGKNNYLNQLNDQTSHYVGMLATIMNALVLHDFLKAINVRAKVYSAIDVAKITEPFNFLHIENDLVSDQVLIFAAGTGMPYVSTDTCSAVRAIEMQAEYILMGKDNVAGVYNHDPKKDPNAIFYHQLSYDKIINDKLAVMDLTAVSLCKENKIKILVFNQSEKDAFIRALENKITLTTIS
ncbi:Uridylate kinase [[Mycoplasma] cavipharyngis]|uniref:UMP kinase n=1 Tax=[Mycoplasma] cavipharyngis TaxID=92757 RepID=UPI0037042D4D